MTAQQTYYAMKGGLDQESAAIAVPAGRCIAVINHESVSKGYQRTQGYERYDGQVAPSAAEFWTGTYETGSVELEVGDLINGQTSGATGRVIGITLDSGTWAGGDAAGTIAIDLLVGAFSTAENIRISTTVHAVALVAPALADKNDSANALSWWSVATENRRSDITAVPGSGAVRGVTWHGGKLHAWRDNAGVTAGVPHNSTAAGWAETDLGKSLKFSGGGIYEVQIGDTITDSVSGATATVRYIALDVNTAWASITASGTMILDDVVGSFTLGERFHVGTELLVATITEVDTAVTFPAGGRYELDTHNFYGAVGTERVYGANGVGKAFEFDGNSAVFITTGMPDDRPFLLAAHKNHLFLGFPKGSLQFSALGEPRSFTALLGAAEIGMGKELTNIAPNTAATLIVTTDKSVAVLSGNDSSDFLLETLSDEAGARAQTAKRIGNMLYMDERGIRNVTATQTYGNFRLGTFTTLIQATLESKRNLGVTPVASLVVKGKDQYLLFFDDGSGISIYMGRKNPEAMVFQYPFTVSCAHVAEVNGAERVFVGAEDGYVYELNVGTSFDGALIEAFIQLPFGHQGGPRVLKRYHKAIAELIADPDTTISMVAQFDYGAGLQPYPHGDVFGVRGSGGLWGISNWAEFYWSAPTTAQAEAYLQGVGENMSLIIFSSSNSMGSYILQGLTLAFSIRGQKR